MHIFGAFSAQFLICAGDAARGERALREAMQLNPFHPTYYRGILGDALEELDQNAEAIEILTQSVRRDPDYLLWTSPIGKSLWVG